MRPHYRISPDPAIGLKTATIPSQGRVASRIDHDDSGYPNTGLGVARGLASAPY